MKFSITIIFVLTLSIAYSTEKSDSLEILLNDTTLNNSKKIELRLELLREYRNIIPEKGIDFAKEGLKYLPSSEDSTIYKLKIYNGIGDSYRLTSQNEQAMDYYFKALRLSEKRGDSFWRATALNNIALVYNNIRDYELSLDYLRKSLDLFKLSDDTSMLIQSYNNLASIYWNKKNIDSSSKYFTYAFELSKKKNDLVGLLQSYNNLGIILLEKKGFYESLEYFSRALEISRDLNDESRRARTLNNLGQVFIGLEKYNSAEFNIKEALGIATQLNAKAIAADSYYYLSELYKQTGNFEKALEFSEKYNNTKDSLYNREKNRRIQKLQEEYRVSKKEAENQLLAQRNDYLSKQEYYKNIILVISGLLFILIVTFLAIRYRSKKKSNDLLQSLNAELDKKNNDLENLNATKDKIFSIVAHDLKNPLSGFRNITSVLLDYYNDMQEEEIISSLGQIRESSNNLLLLLENLLIWARLQKNEVNARPEKIALNLIVEKYIEHYKEKAQDKNIKISFNHNKMDVFAYCDVNLISIVIKNLISNAIKYSEPNKSINIELENLDNKAVFTIVDNGIGIEEKKLENIFEIGNNSSTFGTDGERGTGLGLILSNSFIHMNEGEIWIDSKENNGTKVTFELPAKH